MLDLIYLGFLREEQTPSKEDAMARFDPYDVGGFFLTKWVGENLEPIAYWEEALDGTSSRKDRRFYYAQIRPDDVAIAALVIPEGYLHTFSQEDCSDFKQVWHV